MRTGYFILIISFGLCLTSCKSLLSDIKNDLLVKRSTNYPTCSFGEIPDITALDGTYKNIHQEKSDRDTYKKYKGRLSNIFHLPSDSIDAISFKFDNRSMTLTFNTDSTRHERVYKGEFKENRYFEVFLNKLRIPVPFICFLWDTERVRIGRYKENGFLIHYWMDNIGWMYFAVTMRDTYDFEYIFEKADPELVLLPTK